MSIHFPFHSEGMNYLWVCTMTKRCPSCSKLHLSSHQRHTELIRSDRHAGRLANFFLPLSIFLPLSVVLFGTIIPWSVCSKWVDIFIKVPPPRSCMYSFLKLFWLRWFPILTLTGGHLGLVSNVTIHLPPLTVSVFTLHHFLGVFTTFCLFHSRHWKGDQLGLFHKHKLSIFQGKSVWFCPLGSFQSAL